MKTFKFQQIKVYKTVWLLGAAIACLFITNLESFYFKYPMQNSGLKWLAYALIVLHFSKTLWHKYYVSYNYKALTIRLNRNILEERTFQYKHVKDVVLKNDIIHFSYRNKTETIALSGFDLNDVTKIVQLLRQDF
jgi:hypothetical protein